MPYYQHAERNEVEVKIKFGDSYLIIQDQQNDKLESQRGTGMDDERFKCTSEIRQPDWANNKSSKPSHFCFGNDLTQKNAVNSIVPGVNKFKIHMLEVWDFAKRTNK